MVKNWKRQDAPIQNRPAAASFNEPAPRHNDAPISEQGQDLEDRRFWPAAKPMPGAYVKQEIPCPECRRVRLDDGGRASVMQQSGKEVSYFRCKACGHRWQLPVSIL